MLDQNDIHILKNMLETVVDERLAISEASILRKVDERLAKSENLILDEVERTRNIMENQIARIKKNLEELDKYYRLTKLESDNTALLLQMIEKIDKSVTLHAFIFNE